MGLCRAVHLRKQIETYNEERLFVRENKGRLQYHLRYLFNSIVSFHAYDNSAATLPKVTNTQ